jgi:hypothetical protein
MRLLLSLALIVGICTFIGGRSVAGAQEEPDPCAAEECVPLADYEALEAELSDMTDLFERANHRTIILESKVRELRTKLWAVRYAKKQILKRLRYNSRAAIRYVFGRWAGQALQVSYCESRWSRTARNGQYLGLFQMGSYARSRYGHSSTAIGQARAAFRYFRATGYTWRPWACQPSSYGGVL